MTMHTKSRDVLPWGSASGDPNTPPDIPNRVYKPLQTDSAGNLYVVPLALDPGTGLLNTIPLTELGSTNGANSLAVLGAQNPLLWLGENINSFAPQGAHTADNMDASNPAAQKGGRVALVADMGEWSLTHQPAIATRATITRAAVANSRHVCRSISASFVVAAADVAAVGVLVNLRDGATGAGTILWSKRLAVVVNGGMADVDLSGLNIVGSVNTAMTLEFSAAPGAGSYQTVAISGRTANVS